MMIMNSIQNTSLTEATKKKEKQEEQFTMTNAISQANQTGTSKALAVFGGAMVLSFLGLGFICYGSGTDDGSSLRSIATGAKITAKSIDSVVQWAHATVMTLGSQIANSSNTDVSVPTISPTEKTKEQLDTVNEQNQEKVQENNLRKGMVEKGEHVQEEQRKEEDDVQEEEKTEEKKSRSRSTEIQSSPGSLTTARINLKRKAKNVKETKETKKSKNKGGDDIPSTDDNGNIPRADICVINFKLDHVCMHVHPLFNFQHTMVSEYITDGNHVMCIRTVLVQLKASCFA